MFWFGNTLTSVSLCFCRLSMISFTVCSKYCNSSEQPLISVYSVGVDGEEVMKIMAPENTHNQCQIHFRQISNAPQRISSDCMP